MPDVGYEDDVVKYAIERLIHFGDIAGVPTDKEKLVEIAKLIQSGGVSSENLLKAVTELVAQASFLIEQKRNERSSRAKTMVDVTIKNINGMKIEDALAKQLAKQLETDPKFDSVITKPIDDYNDDDFNLYEDFILTRAFEALLNDNNLNDLFNTAINNNAPQEDLPSFEVGDKNFLAAKDAFIKDVVKFMRLYRGEPEKPFRSMPYDEQMGEMLHKAALGVFSGGSGSE